jgi:chemotaxis methyl-accepting protein methylase
MLIKQTNVDDILEVVREKTAIDLTGYRRQTLFLHITERVDDMQMNVDDYVKLCHVDEHECRQLIAKVSIHVSSFFRNPAMYEILFQSVLPQLLSEKKGELRVWSAACAAGEEPYSLAILIKEAITTLQEKDLLPLIFATDLNTDVLSKAKKGLYSRDSLQDTKLRIVDKYFIPKHDSFLLSKDVKNMVHFSIHNLLSEKTSSPAESLYGAFDLILCRNVLIYFAIDMQHQVQERLCEALAVGGFLVLGSSEALCMSLKYRFKVIDFRNRIYQKKV